MKRRANTERQHDRLRLAHRAFAACLAVLLWIPGVVSSQEPKILSQQHGEEPLGTRHFVLGGESQYFMNLPNAGPVAPLALGPWRGGLALEASAPDEEGIATVTGDGSIFSDIFDGANGRNCRRVESCTGVLYCQGGANVDVLETLDGEGCQYVAGGSGNAAVAVTGTGEEDSGAGALLLQCQVSETLPVANQTPDCASLPDEAYGTPRQIYLTTGTHATDFIATCDNGAPFETLSLTGEPFDCAHWDESGSGGTLVFTKAEEEPATNDEGASLPFDIIETSLLQDVATATCGNGVTETGEECEADLECAEDFYCSDSCACTPDPVCGNAILEDGEDCDVGGIEDAACDDDCSQVACGDGNLNLAAGETCEEDAACGSDEICGNLCGCVAANTCGNSRIEGEEVCDDGNSEAADGCAADCTPELPYAIKLVNFNLLHDVNADNDIEDRLALTADALVTSDPDIVTLLEVTEINGTATSVLLATQLSQQFGSEYYSARYGEPSAGQAVISRWPVELLEVEKLPTVEQAPDFPDPRFFGRIRVSAPVGPIDVYAIHLCATSRLCDQSLRSTQTEAVLSFIEANHEGPYPYVVGGDFNAHRGTAEDADPNNDEPIDLWLEAGHHVFFDGADAPCTPDTDAKGCTSSQSLRSETDTTTRRIDNIMTAPDAGGFGWVETGPTVAFAAAAQNDPSPQCAYENPTACTTSTDCDEGDTCNQQSRVCEPESLVCESNDDCVAEASCGLLLWASDHHGVETQMELRSVPIPEPAAITSGLAAWITLSLLATRRLRRGLPRTAIR